MRFRGIICISFILLFVLSSGFAVFASPVDATDPTDAIDNINAGDVVPMSLADGWLQGAYFVECRLDIGYVFRIFVPASTSTNVFALDAGDYIINTSNDIIYGYCDDLRYEGEYTGLVRWQIFGRLEAQVEVYDNNRYYYEWWDIGGYAPTMANIQIMSVDPPTAVPDYMWSIVGFGITVFCAVIIIIFKRG